MEEVLSCEMSVDLCQIARRHIQVGKYWLDIRESSEEKFLIENLKRKCHKGDQDRDGGKVMTSMLGKCNRSVDSSWWLSIRSRRVLAGTQELHLGCHNGQHFLTS
jgi:hypothetical protein